MRSAVNHAKNHDKFPKSTSGRDPAQTLQLTTLTQKIGLYGGRKSHLISGVDNKRSSVMYQEFKFRHREIDILIDLGIVAKRG